MIEYPTNDKDTRVEGVEVRAAFETYRMDMIQFKNQSRKTEEAYSAAQKRLYEYFGDKPIAELTFEDVRKWKQWLDHGRSPDTVRGYIISLRVVLAYCLKQKLPVLDPDLIPVPKRCHKIPSFVSEKEVTQFIKEASKKIRGYPEINRLRNKAIISLLYGTGIRASELCSLDRNSIKNDSFTVVGKGGKSRLCFIDKRTRQYITEYLAVRTDGNKALFIACQTSGRITTGTLQRIFLGISHRAKLEVPIHPHTLRHSFATNLLRNNCNMRYVQVLLGHSSLATTQLYAQVVDEDLRKVYAQFHTL